MTKEKYKLKVGDKVRLPHWPNRNYVTILWIGKTKVMVMLEKEGAEVMYSADEKWELHKEKELALV